MDDSRSGHGDANEVQVEDKRSRRTLASRRQRKAAIAQLHESQVAALAAMAAEAADQVGDGRSMRVPLHNPLAHVLLNSGHHRGEAGRGREGGDLRDEAAGEKRMAAWRRSTIRKAWLVSEQNTPSDNLDARPAARACESTSRVRPPGWPRGLPLSLASLDIVAYTPNGRVEAGKTTLLYETMGIAVNVLAIMVVQYGAHPPSDSAVLLWVLKTSLDGGCRHVAHPPQELSSNRRGF